MSQYFLEPYEGSGGNRKVELNLFNYATKADLKEANGIYVSTLVSETILSTLKNKVNNLDVDKLKTVPADLSKPSNSVNDMTNIIKNIMISWLSKLMLLILRY